MRVKELILALFTFLIPIEYKYCKPLHRFSEWLLPADLHPWNYETRIALFVTDFLIIALFFLYRPKLRSFFAHPIWLVFLSAFFSILASPFAHYAVPYFHLLHLLTPILLFLLFSEGKIETIRPLAIALIAAGIFQSAVALYQHFFQTTVGLKFFGELKELNSSLCKADGSFLFRASGTMNHANILGGFMLLPIVSAITFGKKAQWLLPLFISALFTTYSRSAIIGLAICLSTYLISQKRKAALFPITIFLLLFSYFYPQLTYRRPLTKEIVSSNRTYYQKFAFDIIRKYPLFGLGYTQYLERAKDLLPKDAPPEYTGPHNVFLYLACETGLMSFFALLLSGMLLIYRALFSFWQKETSLFLGLFLAIIFICCCDLYPIIYQEGRLIYFLSAALLATHCNQHKKAAKELQSTNAQLPSAQ
jgi:O-antigen ligase